MLGMLRRGRNGGYGGYGARYGGGASMRPSAHVARFRGQRRKPPPEAVEHHQVRRLETSAEVTISNFLEPFSLANYEDAVHMIAGAGYTTPNALRALDEEQLRRLGLSDSDSQRVLLAAWLHSLGLAHYGPDLVAHGYRSLLGLLALNDEHLKGAGISTIGHRRLIQRELRGDPLVQSMAEASREKQAADKKGRKVHGNRARNERGSGAVGDAVSRDLDLMQHGLREMPGAMSRISMQREAWSDEWRTVGKACLGSSPGVFSDVLSVPISAQQDGATWGGSGVQVVYSNGKPAMRVW